MAEDSERIIDPQSGEAVRVHDARTAIAAETRATKRDPAAERAFIQARIALLEGDTRLSAAEKQEAVRQLRAMLR